MQQNTTLVSIIIPTYNRASLISETLDSILKQSYFHWECLVIDDGSTDSTADILRKYIEKDLRFQYHIRPNFRPKGGNGARNYGFEISKGTYVQWFDSDDLMEPQFLELKLNALMKDPSLGFVVSKSINFLGKEEQVINHYEGNINLPLNLFNFLNKSVYWMTPDVLLKKEIVLNIPFDERLKSAQETNFFVRFLAQGSLKGHFLDEILTKRRIHAFSIQQKAKKDHKKASRGKLLSLLYAFFAIRKKVDTQIKMYMVNELMMLFYHLKLQNFPIKDFLKFTFYLVSIKGIFKSFSFFIAVFIVSIFNKGYNLINYARS